MEYVSGPSLRKWCEGKTTAQISKAFLAIAETTLMLHNRDACHNDLKPANIRMTRDGHPKILDFGTVTKTGTRAGGFRGTLGYAAPEIVSGQACTPQSDMYSLGVVFYHAVTGKLRSRHKIPQHLHIYRLSPSIATLYFFALGWLDGLRALS